MEISEESENVRVVVRCRPLSNKEIDKNCANIVALNRSDRTVKVVDRTGSQHTEKEFTYDAVFPIDATQAEVYNEVARPIIENVLRGYNGTIFAYGQTGTGKTFTMEGDNNVPELKGIIPNSFAQIFSHISKTSGDIRFLVRCSYMEIYKEDIRDLLSKDVSKKLELKENPQSGIYVKDLKSFVVANANDMDTIMSTGNKHRSVASTSMNSVSSRSHAIFTINVECSEGIVGGTERTIRMGKLNLVDLAGSERLSKTGAQGERLKEATKINLSLSNLGIVISALVEGNSHIPYRNSKLTRLLQDSLGGNAKTVMCANIGPADYNYEETVSTLRYANRAKSIRNHARVNEDPKDALLRQFESEIELLRRQLIEEEAGGGGDSLEGQFTSMPDDDETGIYYSDISTLLIPDEHAISEIKNELQTQEQLSSNIGDATTHRKNIVSELREKVDSYKKHEMQKSDLYSQLETIQKKILVGGENLLDKSQLQEEMLLRAMEELKAKSEAEKELTSTLQTKEMEQLELEKVINEVNNENRLLGKRIKKLFAEYQQSKLEVAQMKEETEQETTTMVEDINKMSRELKHQSVLIDSFIPGPLQDLIEESCTYHDEAADWSLKCIAYTGNNMRRNMQETEEPKKQSVNLSNMYLSLATAGNDDFWDTEIDSHSRNHPGQHRGISGNNTPRPSGSRNSRFDNKYDNR